MADREAESVERIEATRRVLRKAMLACHEQGRATVEEVAIGALYAVYDVAEKHAGQGVAAIEWLRDGCDILEHGVMNGLARR